VIHGLIWWFTDGQSIWDVGGEFLLARCALLGWSGKYSVKYSKHRYWSGLDKKTQKKQV
jgi:hypothetical protein